MCLSFYENEKNHKYHQNNQTGSLKCHKHPEAQQTFALGQLEWSVVKLSESPLQIAKSGQDASLRVANAVLSVMSRKVKIVYFVKDTIFLKTYISYSMPR